jgi:hypothetical protein
MDAWYHVLRGRTIGLTVTVVMVNIRRADEHTASIQTVRVEGTNLDHLS